MNWSFRPGCPILSVFNCNSHVLHFKEMLKLSTHYMVGFCVVTSNYTPGIYADGYIVFVFPFVCSSVCMFVRSYFRHVCRICVKVLRQSFSSGVYLSNYLSESIHIWTIVTLEGWHSLHDRGPQGPCPGVGLEVKL